MLNNILNYEIWGNSGLEYLTAVGIFLALSLIFYLIQKILLKKAKKMTEKTETDLDDFLLKVIQNIKPPFYLAIAFYIAARSLVLMDLVGDVVYGIFVVAVVAQIILILQRVIDYAVRKRIAKFKGEEKGEEAITKLISQIIKFTLWIIGILLILQNLGVNVTSLIAGFGIGGVAVALAAQAILGDLFASFSIFVDKPFTVGDYISIGNESGTVKKIGIKSTRIKTLQGDELIVSNNDLTSARVNNYKRMERRRISFDVGVTYGTNAEKLEKIPMICKNIIEKVENVEFSRAHFKSFGDFSLIYEVVYFVEVSDYDVYMDVQQEINLGIYKEFEKEGIAFAFPTQTVFLNKEQ